MTEIRPRIWIAATACCAVAVALPVWMPGGGGEPARMLDADAGDAGGRRARIWPPPDAAPPLELPPPAPAAEPVTREQLRDLWDAEDAAARLATESGLYTGFELPPPPREPGESRDAHRRRAEALRRRALADVLLAEDRMRQHYERSELPQGGLFPHEYRRRFGRASGPLGPRERLEALERARGRIEALRSQEG